ncbi:HepT-like ribonuclease domain-containing protein [Enhydrobacter sp.]|uniref:HepT-like ribonuclease domain-containing protein n=1 Tax=Enhydrobacter sp. TaxID=1894999 RepID=UPI0026266CA1|nr:HepT-like ribonuclease domain-containing protein [Enhydrobacter sp.]
MPERDAALLLDMLLAVRDAKAFVEGLDEAAFLASRLHQNAVIRSLEVLGEAAGKISATTKASHPEIPGEKSRACAIVSSMAIPKFASTLSGWC